MSVWVIFSSLKMFYFYFIFLCSKRNDFYIFIFNAQFHWLDSQNIQNYIHIFYLFTYFLQKQKCLNDTYIYKKGACVYVLYGTYFWIIASLFFFWLYEYFCIVITTRSIEYNFLFIYSCVIRFWPSTIIYISYDLKYLLPICELKPNERMWI